MKNYLCISICLTLALLASCGDDDNFVRPKLETGAPLAQVADLPDSLDLMSDAPVARDAQAWALDLFHAVWGEAGLARAALYPSQFLPWSRTDGGCWRCSYGNGADTLEENVYLACPAVHGHTWRFDYRKWCDHHVVCDYRPLARGTTGTAGRTGAFSEYFPYDSTQVLYSWEWTASAGADSIHWTFYRGAIEHVKAAATMDWSVSADGTRHWIWAWPADERWEMQVASDPSTGWLKDYIWNASTGAWRISHIFNWAGGHGTWDKYNASGALIESLSW
ncbi:MAG: hypothetical protein ABR899_08835 [Candidatus Krumholzibacteriaceae bacterium]